MSETQRLIIGGEEQDAASGETFESTDPSRGEPFATVAKAGPDDVHRALEAARAAFDEGPWPRMKGSQRAEILLEVANRIKEHGKQLAETEAQDSGGTIRKGKFSDVAMAVSSFRVYAKYAAEERNEEPLERSPRSMNYVRREPIGVCAAITPWNFPLQMAGWKIAPAIAAGNAVVLKPPVEAPLTSLLIGKLCAEAGVPEGVVSVVPGPGSVAGEALVSSPLVDKISFTGSTEVGRRIMQLASGTMAKVTLELGGKSPAIVLDDADLDYAVEGVLWGIFFHQGQVCSAGTRLFLPASIHDSFVERMVERAERMKIGPALDMASDLGPVISKTQLETVERYVEIGKGEGAEVATGGERAEVEGYEGGFYYRPTILLGRNDMKIAQEEIFGPVLTVIRYEDEDDLVRMANDSIYGLAAAIWTGDNARAIGIAERLRTGTVWINDHHMINPRYPFGGYKQSGIGREHGRQGFDEFRETKHIHVDLVGQRREQHPWWDQLLPRREDSDPAKAAEKGRGPAG
jgi:aldehyde dehydrogenase (NAD+)